MTKQKPNIIIYKSVSFNFKQGRSYTCRCVHIIIYVYEPMSSFALSESYLSVHTRHCKGYRKCLTFQRKHTVIFKSYDGFYFCIPLVILLYLLDIP